MRRSSAESEDRKVKISALERINADRNDLNAEAVNVLYNGGQSALLKSGVAELQLMSNQLGSQGAQQIAAALDDDQSRLRVTNVLRNGCSNEAANKLKDRAAAKRVSLCGISEEQHFAALNLLGLRPVDAIFLGSDMRMRPLVALDLSYNKLGLPTKEQEVEERNGAEVNSTPFNSILFLSKSTQP